MINICRLRDLLQARRSPVGRWLKRCSITALILTLGSGTARAELCERSLALRVNERGLDLIVKLVRPLLPEAIEVPALDQVVVDWPLTDDDARVQMAGMAAKLKVIDLRAFMDEGSLYIQGTFNVSAAGPVTVLNPYASFGKAECQASLDLKNVQLQIGALLESDNNRTRMQVVTAKINFDNQATTADLGGCALGNVLSAVAGLLKNQLIKAAEAGIGAIAKTKIPALVESKLDTTMQLEAKTEGLAVGIKLDGLNTDAAGLSALISASLQSTTAGAPACLAGMDLAPPSSCVGAMPSVRPGVDAMFGAGISEPLLQQAVHALWRGGRLCIDSRTASENPLVGENLGKMAAGLGLPANAELAFQARMARPPTIKFGTSAGISLDLTGFRVDLQIKVPGADPSQVGVEIDAAVSALPWVDPQNASLALDLRSMAVRRVQLIGEQSTVGMDVARLQRFVSEVVLPMLQKKLDGQALSPTVVNGMGQFLIDLRQIEVANGFASAYIDAYVPAAAPVDPHPPETSLLEKPGPIVGPQLIRFTVTGSDNQTPRGLLRYRARVDSGEWSTPTYSRRIDVAATAGVHTIEIAAIDLKGNIDPTPALMQVLVDAVPPTLNVKTRPESLLLTSTAEVELTATDDLTPSREIEVQGELYRVPSGGGAPELVAVQAPDRGAESIRFEGLEEGVYKLRVVVRDEAGNVTSEDLGFTVHLESGCQAGPGAPASPLAFLLIGLGLLLCRRRGAAR